MGVDTTTGLGGADTHSHKSSPYENHMVEALFATSEISAAPKSFLLTSSEGTQDLHTPTSCFPQENRLKMGGLQGHLPTAPGQTYCS